VVMNQRSAPPRNVEPEPNNNVSVDYRVVMNRPAAPANSSASNVQLASLSTQKNPSQMRPAVRNSIEALRAMPPTARARELNSGRYAGFTPKEREVLNLAAEAPQVQ